MERWVGKVVIVTGASSGIGAEMAVRLADLGLIVIGMARRKHLIDKIAEKVTGKGKIYSKQVDLSKSSEIREAFEWIEQKFGGADILVNNAAYLPVGYITDIGDKPEVNDEEIKLAVDVNVTGIFLASRLAVKNMRKRGVAGHIVNINSVCGHYVAHYGTASVYGATKHTIAPFTHALINELAKFNSKIKVTSLSPGVVNTAMLPSELVNAPRLECSEVVDALIYVLSTPPTVQIYELGLKAVGEGLL
ncbi:unnamed protein product, partial [Brenthis ino]